MKIYLASSWRNEKYESTREFLQKLGHEVYNFKNAESAFDWKEIDPAFEMLGGVKTRGMAAGTFQGALRHPLAERGYKSDANAIFNADLTVLLLPCGRSAHIEFGMAVGYGVATGKKFTIVLLDDPISEPELMYLGATCIVKNLQELESAVSITASLVESIQEHEDARSEGRRPGACGRGEAR